MTISSRRGLTLLEVLISAAILAALAAAVVPGIARSMRVLSEPLDKRTIQISDLSALADSFIDTPEAFGYKGDRLHTIDRGTFEWPISPASPVTITALRKSNAGGKTDHLWLRFQCDGINVARWITVPPPTREDEVRP